ncbi:MAG: Gfo/Idh/MocA family oxidoreductase, partial [Gammaproteobacteria bacterium]|nr:Gfo/Idh/MocA family oxidoreductase [Gammaproteobacteria bacterium]
MGMKPKPLSVALLGTGRISETQLAPALAAASGLRLWSVLSRDRGRAAGFARRHRARSPDPGYARLDEMLADPKLDAVLIATPDALHAEQALAAIAAGKHVFAEKPMVTSSADGRRVVEAAEAAGVTVGVAYHLRWHGGHRAMERLIRGGALGALRHMRVQWTWPAPDDSNWRAGSDVGRWWSLAG